jgi:hypothetical protein
MIKMAIINIINEELAKRSKENMSFSDYKIGSATAEYNEAITEATKKIEQAKLRASEDGKKRLDYLLESYKNKLAAWTNNYNANGSRHVSVMISGPSNYNMRAHDKYMSREGKLWEEYDKIKTMIDYGISRIIYGEKIISSDNPNAVELLKDKIAKLEKNQEMMKAANKIIRNSKLDQTEKINQLVEIGFTEECSKKLFIPDCFGGIGFEGFTLTNNNANINRLKKRLAGLEKKANEETAEKESNGVKIVDNVEYNRLQIFFPGKPSDEIRTYLKSSGFHWSPHYGCWQRMRSNDANCVAEKAAAMAD